MDNKNSLGILTISKKAIVSLIAHIAENCEGVVQLTERSKRDGVNRYLRGGEKGVYLERKGSKCTAHIYIVGRYGVNAADIGGYISEKIKLALTGTGIEVSVKVNIVNVEVKNEYR